VGAAVDMYYSRTGGARAAAVLAADAAFAHLLAARTVVVPGTALPARTVLPARVPTVARGPARSDRAGPADGRRLGRPGPRWSARPGCACAPRFRRSSDRGRQVQVAHGHPRGAGPSRILGWPAVHQCSRDARSRRHGAGPARDPGRRRLPDALRRSYTLAQAEPPAVRMTDRRPPGLRTCAVRRAIATLIMGAGPARPSRLTGVDSFVNPKRSRCRRRATGTSGRLQATGLGHRPIRERGSVVLHPTISATRIERVRHWLQLKLMVRRLAVAQPGNPPPQAAGRAAARGAREPSGLAAIIPGKGSPD
jgi:hypothetical protein